MNLRTHGVSKNVLSIQIGILTSAVNISSNYWLPKWMIVRKNWRNSIAWLRYNVNFNFWYRLLSHGGHIEFQGTKNFSFAPLNSFPCMSTRGSWYEIFIFRPRWLPRDKGRLSWTFQLRTPHWKLFSGTGGYERVKIGVRVIMLTPPEGDWSSSTVAFSWETAAILFVRLTSKL